MAKYIEHIKDSLGNNYLGIKIQESEISSYLEELKGILGDDFDEWTGYQKQRDGGKYHITVINVMDYNSLSKSLGIDKFVLSLDKIFKWEIDDLRLMGIGSATKNENTAYFIVCKSDKLNRLRETYGLKEHHFHITLAFKWKDVFGVPKNNVLEKKSKFIQLLKKEWIESENFNFIKKCQNYDLDPTLEIIPISISDDFLKVKVGEFVMDIGLYDNNKFRVFTKYKDSKDLEKRRIPTSELLEYLNKK